jgi:hypothetical protein
VAVAAAANALKRLERAAQQVRELAISSPVRLFNHSPLARSATLVNEGRCRRQKSVLFGGARRPAARCLCLAGPFGGQNSTRAIVMRARLMRCTGTGGGRPARTL